MGGDGYIARQSPGCGGPDQQGGALVIHQWQADKDRWILGFCIPQGNFVVGKRGAATRTIRHHFEPLVEQVLFPQGLQDPPDRLDIIVGIGDVSLFEIHPKSDAIGQAFPVLDVLEGGFAA